MVSTGSSFTGAVGITCAVSGSWGETTGRGELAGVALAGLRLRRFLGAAWLDVGGLGGRSEGAALRVGVRRFAVDEFVAGEPEAFLAVFVVAFLA